MTFSILWVVLAATVTIVANQDQGEVRVRQSGKALTVVAIVYSLVLLVGFLYIGWQHGLALMR
jgi:uncharacterized membrane-anchored protein